MLRNNSKLLLHSAKGYTKTKLSPELVLWVCTRQTTSGQYIPHKAEKRMEKKNNEMQHSYTPALTQRLFTAQLNLSVGGMAEMFNIPFLCTGPVVCGLKFWPE